MWRFSFRGGLVPAGVRPLNYVPTRAAIPFSIFSTQHSKSDRCARFCNGGAWVERTHWSPQTYRRMVSWRTATLYMAYTYAVRSPTEYFSKKKFPGRLKFLLKLPIKPTGNADCAVPEPVEWKGSRTCAALLSGHALGTGQFGFPGQPRLPVRGSAGPLTEDGAARARW